MYVIASQPLGDEQQSSEDTLDVLSESADDEMVENEVLVAHTSEVHSPGHTKEEPHLGQACAVVNEEDHYKGIYLNYRFLRIVAI